MDNVADLADKVLRELHIYQKPFLPRKIGSEVLQSLSRVWTTVLVKSSFESSDNGIHRGVRR